MNNNLSSEYSWINVDGIENIPSPALFFYKERIIENIKRTIAIAGDVEFLRPHVKTHKTAEIIKLQLEQGITKFKCSTIAEVEMVASCGAKDILLAYEPVGPNIDRLIQLIQNFPNQSISAIVDSDAIVNKLSNKAKKAEVVIPLFLDINNGLNRTGIKPDNEFIQLCHLIIELPNLSLKGFHVYDGHIHETNFEKRKIICDDAFAPIDLLIDQLNKSEIKISAIVAGGTLTFPIHAGRKNIESSPGTTFLWDFGYSSKFADLDFLHAALIFTRVVSKPDENILCFDLGTKAVCDEMPNPRVYLIGLNDYEIIKHNEEHLVVKTSEANHWKIGDYCFGIPYHICPTVIRYESAYIVQNNQIVDEWKIIARTRKITI